MDDLRRAAYHGVVADTGDHTCAIRGGTNDDDSSANDLDGESGASAACSGGTDGAAGAGLRALLSGQLREVRRLLASQHKEVLLFAQQELIRSLDGESGSLRQENQRLRHLLSCAGSGLIAASGLETSAGTGEASASLVGVSDVTKCKSDQTARTRTSGRRARAPIATLQEDPEEENLPGVVNGTWDAVAAHASLVKATKSQKQAAFYCGSGGRSDSIVEVICDQSALPAGRPSQDSSKTLATAGREELHRSYKLSVESMATETGDIYRNTSRGTLSSKPQAKPSSNRFHRARTLSVASAWATKKNPSEENLDNTMNAISQSPEKPLLPDKESIKEHVRLAINHQEYNVMDYYKLKGIPQRICRSPIFEFLTLSVISLNALYMAIDADYNREPVLYKSKWYFQATEHAFCTYFTSELMLRFLSFRVKCDATRDRWFVFDLILVVLMTFETWVMTVVISRTSWTNDWNVGDFGIAKILRLLRLVRMARVVRLMRACPELVILVKGMVMAGRSVFFTLCLLVIIIYVFAIGFCIMLRDTEAGDMYFATVPAAMNSLLLHGCFGEDFPDVMNAVGAESIFLGGVLLVFVLLASLTVMNMLMGILVEVVSVVAAVEKETLIVNFVKQKMECVIRLIEPEFDGQISRPLFIKLLQHPDALKALQEVGVDVIGLVDFSDFIFEEEVVAFTVFMELVLSLRGTNKATVRDIVDLRKCVLQDFSRLEMKLLRKQEDVMTRSCSQLSSASIVSKPTIKFIYPEPEKLHPGAACPPPPSHGPPPKLLVLSDEEEV